MISIRYFMAEKIQRKLTLQAQRKEKAESQPNDVGNGKPQKPRK